MSAHPDESLASHLETSYRDYQDRCRAQDIQPAPYDWFRAGYCYGAIKASTQMIEAARAKVHSLAGGGSLNAQAEELD